MKALVSALFFCLTAVQFAPAQVVSAGTPNLPDDAVIAIFEDGAKMTMGEFNFLLGTQPAEMQQVARMNARQFIQYWAGMRKLAKLAEQEKLDQKPEVKAQLEYAHVAILGQVKMNDTLNSIMPSSDEIEKYYASHKDRYVQVKVKAIYIAYGDAVPSGKKQITEADAKAKAQNLLEEIRKGADFVKLAKENSDDETSRDQDGDFATFKPKDNIPDAIRSAVLSLKQGEVTEPIKQANGFYLLKATDVSLTPLDQVRGDLLLEIRQQQYNAWLKDHNDNLKIEFPNKDFPSAGPTVTLSPQK